jgi:hypothetical protein
MKIFVSDCQRALDEYVLGINFAKDIIFKEIERNSSNNPILLIKELLDVTLRYRSKLQDHEFEEYYYLSGKIAVYEQMIKALSRDI